jgi:CDP-4-dehydro-6-deoxyglucose reductase
MAGQRARLTLEDGASGEVPIASCPCNGRNLQFYLRRRPGDTLAESAFASLGPHQMITLKGPVGAFVLHEESPDPAVFIALDDGIAPIKSILEHAVSIDTIEAFHLYWANNRTGSQQLAKWCRAMTESSTTSATAFAEIPTGESRRLKSGHDVGHPRRAGCASISPVRPKR